MFEKDILPVFVLYWSSRLQALFMGDSSPRCVYLVNSVTQTHCLPIGA